MYPLSKDPAPEPGSGASSMTSLDWTVASRRVASRRSSLIRAAQSQQQTAVNNPTTSSHSHHIYHNHRGRRLHWNGTSRPDSLFSFHLPFIYINLTCWFGARIEPPCLSVPCYGPGCFYQQAADCKQQRLLSDAECRGKVKAAAAAAALLFTS